MKNLTIGLMLAALVLTVGAVWATENEATAAEVPVEAVTPDVQVPEADVELPSSFDAELTEVMGNGGGACCVVECFAAMDLCMLNGVPEDLACKAACRSTQIACRQAC